MVSYDRFIVLEIISLYGYRMWYLSAATQEPLADHSSELITIVIHLYADDDRTVHFGPVLAIPLTLSPSNQTSRNMCGNNV